VHSEKFLLLGELREWVVNRKQQLLLQYINCQQWLLFASLALWVLVNRRRSHYSILRVDWKGLKLVLFLDSISCIYERTSLFTEVLSELMCFTQPICWKLNCCIMKTFSGVIGFQCYFHYYCNKTSCKICDSQFILNKVNAQLFDIWSSNMAVFKETIGDDF